VGKSLEMEKLLRAELAPTYLVVSNESEKHQGHSGYSDGETHFKIAIKSPLLTGSRVSQHRKIYQTLDGISYHALAIEL